MRTITNTGDIVQTMHAVFDGDKQLTSWRTAKDATMGALHRSSYRAKGGLRVRDRNYVGLTMRTKAFVTPARSKEAIT